MPFRSLPVMPVAAPLRPPSVAAWTDRTQPAAGQGSGSTGCRIPPRPAGKKYSSICSFNVLPADGLKPGGTPALERDGTRANALFYLL